MAIGTMLVVLCAVIGSLTVLPAALAKLGDRVDRGRVPFFGQQQARRRRVALLGLRARPRAAPAGRSRSSLAGGLLLAAASPALSACTRSCRASPTCRRTFRS